MARSKSRSASKRKRKPVRAAAPEAPTRPDARDLVEGVGPVRWNDTEAQLTRELGLIRSSMVGYRLVPRPWVLSSGEPMVIELRFHAGSGRIEELRAAWHGDDDCNFDAWFAGDAPRHFEALLTAMGCTLTGHQRFQCDPAKAGEIATLGEGDGDVYRGPGDVVVHTWLNFDPPEFVLTFAPPASSVDDVTDPDALAASVTSPTRGARRSPLRAPR